MARLTKSPARYVLRGDDPEKNELGGLNWLASRRKNFAHGDGKPHLVRIADAAGLDTSTLSELASEKALLGMGSMAALTRVAMRTGVSRRTAEERLYDLIEIKAADDVKDGTVAA